jgi:hypothetical protein
MKADRDVAAKDVEDELLEGPYVDVCGSGEKKPSEQLASSVLNPDEKPVTENEINRSSSCDHWLV